MIRVFTTGQTGERWISLEDVNIHTQGICPVFSTPYILFEHSDYPLGALKAEYNGEHWACDLD
jgi:hypothetical protein